MFELNTYAGETFAIRRTLLHGGEEGNNLLTRVCRLGGVEQLGDTESTLEEGWRF